MLVLTVCLVLGHEGASREAPFMFLGSKTRAPAAPDRPRITRICAKRRMSQPKSHECRARGVLVSRSVHSVRSFPKFALIRVNCGQLLGPSRPAPRGSLSTPSPSHHPPAGSGPSRSCWRESKGTPQSAQTLTGRCSGRAGSPSPCRCGPARSWCPPSSPVRYRAG